MRRDVPISASDIDAAPRLPERILAIDRYRGLLVILMVGGDYLSGVQLVPAALKHAPDIGFTIADTVASAFVFTVGLNYGPSFARRMKKSIESRSAIASVISNRSLRKFQETPFF